MKTSNNWKKHLLSIEYGLTILGILLYSGSILTLALSGGISEGEFGDDIKLESPLIKQIFAAFYGITVILLGCRWKKSLYVASKNIYILLFVILAMFSINWTDRKSTRLNSSHRNTSRMPSSA